MASRLVAATCALALCALLKTSLHSKDPTTTPTSAQETLDDANGTLNSVTPARNLATPFFLSDSSRKSPVNGSSQTLTASDSQSNNFGIDCQDALSDEWCGLGPLTRCPCRYGWLEGL